jgi:hypothetical protein
MDERKASNNLHMTAGNFQLCEAVLAQFLPEEHGISRKIFFLASLFDSNFPDADNAEDDLVGWILQELARFGRKTGRILAHPEKHVRIEKEFHFSP